MDGRHEASITWGNNLGSTESVAIDLSTDGGTTWAYVLSAGTPSDGSHTVTVQSAWVSASARVRLRWVRDAGVSDVSNHAFAIL